jgi:ATP adenylyltransferase
VSPERTDDDALIVHRGTLAFVILNLYPYNSGHLMVCPYRHVSTYDAASLDEVAEIGSLTQVAMRVLTDATGCSGFNIGMNQGEVAGAGIQDHLHQHIVPRWSNDSNFFPIIAKTKAMPVLLGEMRERLAQHWPNES